jgi:hypothetical protein
MRSTLIPASQLLRCVAALVTPSTAIVATVQRERAAGVRSSTWEREYSAEVEHAQPAEVARRDAGHGEDVAGACVAQNDARQALPSPPRAEHGVSAGEAVEVRGDDAEEDSAGSHGARDAKRSPHSGDGAAMGDSGSSSEAGRLRSSSAYSPW